MIARNEKELALFKMVIVNMLESRIMWTVIETALVWYLLKMLIVMQTQTKHDRPMSCHEV